MTVQRHPQPEAKTPSVMTRPGNFAIYWRHTFENKLLKDLNTPTSKGCKMCDVCDGRHKRCTSFDLANAITSMVICDAGPSNTSSTGRREGIIRTNSLNHSKNISFVIHPFSLT